MKDMLYAVLVLYCFNCGRFILLLLRSAKTTLYIASGDTFAVLTIVSAVFFCRAELIRRKIYILRSNQYLVSGGR